MQPAPARPETISALAATVDEAVALLSARRYSELDIQFNRLRQQAKDLGALKQALDNGAAADPGLQRRCEQLGESLFVFSEVAKQIATIEAGIAQLVAGPREGAYSRDGQCDSTGASRFQQEA